MTTERNELSLPPRLGSNPWIVLHHGRHEQLQTVINVSNGKVHHRSIPEMKGKLCIGSFYGWLLMLDASSRECFLLSLTSLSKISLPPVPEDIKFLSSSNVSSPPTVANCVAMLISDRHPLIFFCRVGDEEWTKWMVNFDDDDSFNGGIVHCKGKVYAHTFNGNLMCIDITSSTINVERMEVENFQLLRPFSGFSLDLVEVCGDIFRVVRYQRTYFTDYVVMVDVQRLDFCKSCWTKVESIGDHAIFLSEVPGITLSASKVGLRPNHIYFTQSSNDAVRLYIFSLDDRCMSFDVPCPSIRRSSGTLYWTTTAI